MTFVPENFLAFSLAAGLLTVTPGVDTALVLRTAATDGPRRAATVGLGIVLGCLTWGMIVAAGLGALLAASQLAYEALRWIGAAYLLYLGIGLLRSPRRGLETFHNEVASVSGARWLARGYLTNMLNPKAGVFYVSFLPQFIPADANVALTSISLAAIHSAMGIVWFAVPILATRPISRKLQEGPAVKWLDRITGGILVAFSAKLAWASR